MKKIAILLVLFSLFLLSACGGRAEEIADLSGTWVETGSAKKTSYQQATIKDGAIKIFWVNTEEQSTALYWAGTYVAPGKAVKEYSWDSVNDKSKTQFALLASGDDKKTFSYKDGWLSYSVSAMGITKEVKLKLVKE